jgi:branched-chain amino acid transport system ATP-binding protein
MRISRMTILKTVGLTKVFGQMRAVDEVSLDFAMGQMTAVIGPNGAGKSTLFNLITGKLVPTSGRVYFKGEDITGKPPYTIVKAGIGRAFQITSIFPGLTTAENVRMGILAYRKKSAYLFHSVDRLDGINGDVVEALEAAGLHEERETIAGAMSHGDQKRLDIVLALTHRPQLLLLDEPTAGMNPEERRALIVLIRAIARDQGVTVIFTEHDMDIVFSVAERIVVMQQGRIIADGDINSVKSNNQVREAYLGVDE